MNVKAIDAFLSLGFPMGTEWLCLLVFVALVALMGVVIYFALRLANPRPPVGPASAFPVAPLAPSGPAQYRVSGVNRQKKADIVWECTADSPENARVKGELEGIVVTRVERA